MAPACSWNCTYTRPAPPFSTLSAGGTGMWMDTTCACARKISKVGRYEYVVRYVIRGVERILAVIGTGGPIKRGYVIRNT
eukprot:9199589-Pyramimonas_sp.AAC.1